MTYSDLLPPFDTLEDTYPNLKITQLADFLYEAKEIGAPHLGFYFGGQSNYEFICDPIVLITVEAFNCSGYDGILPFHSLSHTFFAVK